MLILSVLSCLRNLKLASGQDQSLGKRWGNWQRMTQFLLLLNVKKFALLLIGMRICLVTCLLLKIFSWIGKITILIPFLIIFLIICCWESGCTGCGPKWGRRYSWRGCRVSSRSWGSTRWEFRELDYTCPNGTVFIHLQSANGQSGPTTTYGRYCTLLICMYSNAQPHQEIVLKKLRPDKVLKDTKYP